MQDHNIYRPYSPLARLGACSCGAHASQQAHDDALTQLADARRRQDSEALSHDFVEAAAVQALFPDPQLRRNFLRTVGSGVAMAAIGSLLPLQDLQARALERKGGLEKTDLRIGFVPITCATPLIMAGPLGLYQQQGLNVQLQKTAGWALVRDKLLNRELDASHTLSPMPLAISMGAGSSPQPMRVMAIQNINGQAIVMALKHRENRDPRHWKGFKFAVPFEYSMHNFLLRYYLAEHGLDPDRDVQLRVTPPAEMIANLRAGNIDGFLGPDPFCQRAVYDRAGFIHILTRDIWEGHPCCAFGVSQAFIDQHPQTFLAMYRAILQATAMANKPEERQAIVQAISGPGYLNQPPIVIQQVLRGRFADGLGKVRDVPDRIGFDAMPWHAMASWMLTQMQRWGYIKGQVNYRQLAEQVFLMTDARRLMREAGLPLPPGADSGSHRITVMGKAFDPARPEAYLRSFAIRRT